MRPWLNVKDIAMLMRFINHEDGQDLVEYSLLLAFIALAGAGIYLSLGGNVTTLWTIVNNRLTDASK